MCSRSTLPETVCTHYKEKKNLCTWGLKTSFMNTIAHVVVFSNGGYQRCRNSSCGECTDVYYYLSSVLYRMNCGCSLFTSYTKQIVIDGVTLYGELWYVQ